MGLKTTLARSGIACILVMAIAACSSLPAGVAEQPRTGIKADAADQARLGDEARRNHNLVQAEDAYRRSFELNARVDNLPGMVKARNSLALLYLEARKYDAARNALTEALDIARMDGRPGLAALGWINMARLSMASGQTGEAADFLDKAQADLDRGGIPPVVSGAGGRDIQAVLWHLRAQVLRTQGDNDGALAFLGKARDMNHSLGLGSEEASCLFSMAAIRNRLGDHDQALDLLAQALVLDRTAEATGAIAQDLHAMARVLLARKGPGDAEAARDHGWRAFQSALADNDADMVRKTLVTLAEAAGATGDSGAAAHWKEYLDRLDSGSAVPAVPEKESK